MTTPQISVTEAFDPFDAGPFTGAQRALHLRRAAALDAGRRAVIAGALAWVPLLLLAAFEGLAFGGVDRPFLRDPAAHVRYLVAVPLLVFAEQVVLPMLGGIVNHFRDSGIVPDDARPRFDEIVGRTRASLESRTAEVTIVLLAYAATISAFATPLIGHTSWVAPFADRATSLSLAGWWRMLVSQPLLLALVFAWIWRVLLWGRFLGRVMKLPLRLVAAHSDQAGGLRFVGVSLRAFAPLGFAFSAIVAAGTIELGRRSTVQEIGALAAVVVILVLAIFVLPLIPTTRALKRLRVHGLLEYGAIASRLGIQFESRWMRRGRPVNEEALEAGDFSALVDMSGVLTNVLAIRPLPFTSEELKPLLVATLVPFLLRVLAITPPDTALKIVRGVLL